MSIKRTAFTSSLMKRKISRSQRSALSQDATFDSRRTRIRYDNARVGDDPPSIRDFSPRYFPKRTTPKHEKSRSFCRVTYTRVVAFSLKKARLWRQTSHRKLSLAVDVCTSSCIHMYEYTHTYNTWNKIWFIHISVHAHAYSRLFTRVSAYDALYPRYRPYDRTIMQEMEEIYRFTHERKITNLIKIGIK